MKTFEMLENGYTGTTWKMGLEILPVVEDCDAADAALTSGDDEVYQ